MSHPETSRASRHPFRVAIPAFACALTLVAAADAQARAVDLLFVVDESGSMTGEHAFLESFVSRLDENLEGASFTDRRYGLFGFSGANDRGVVTQRGTYGRSFSFRSEDCTRPNADAGLNANGNGFCSSHAKSWATRDEFLDRGFHPGI